MIGHDPWKPDEAYSFGLVYHILQSGDWVVPTLAQEPFLEKPPSLLSDGSRTSPRVFGGLLPLHDAARLASGLYMAVTLSVGRADSRELHGAGKAGWACWCLLG